MRHMGVHSRRNSLVDNKKVPLNTIVLPPLSPPLPENGAQLIGKVMVNKSKSGNVISGEIVVPRSQDVSPRSVETPKGPENVRIAQLEQNIKFLQEQHHLMLAGLHKEIESLKNRNRELQFQLVFVKGSLPSSGSPSSPEDDTKHKIYTSPKAFNITPLQVEILEKELSDLKLQLQETESRNLYLSAIVDEQKKKLERYERDREKERERAIQPDPELLRKLDDAEAIIRRLRRENSDLRRENTLTTAHYQQQQQPREPPHNQQRDNGYTSPRSNGGNQQTRGNSGGRHRTNNGGHYRGNWFPPLHSQSYWQQGGGRNGDRNGLNGLPTDGQGVLPNLQPGEGPNGTQYQGRRGANNNHYHNGDGRKYRGGQKNHKQT